MEYAMVTVAYFYTSSCPCASLEELAVGAAQAAHAMAWAFFPIRHSAHAQLQMLQQVHVRIVCCRRRSSMHANSSTTG